MADDALAQLVETQTTTEQIVDHLRREQEQYTFSTEEDRSLLRSIYFQEYFLDFVEKILRDFENKKSETVDFRLDILERFSKTEQVTKEQLRQFFNLLVEKLYKRDKLYNSIPELKSFPQFKEGNTSEELQTTAEDVASITFLRTVVLPKLKALHESLLEEKQKKNKKEEQKAEAQPQTAAPVATSAGFGGFGGSSSRASQAQDRVAQDRVSQEPSSTSPTQDTKQLSAFQLQKTILQESWRIASNPLLFDQALNTAMGVSNWRTYYDKLSSDQQREFDFQKESFQEKLAGTISQYLLADNQKARSFITSLQELGHAAVEKRTLKLEEFKGQIQEVVFKTLSNPYAAISVEQIKVVCDLEAYTDSSYKRPQQVADETAQAVGETLDTPEKAKEVYAKGQSDQFKQQLKQIAILTAASSPDSIEQFAEQLMEFYPQIRKGGAGALTREIFDELLPQKAFSVGEDDRQALFKKVGLQLEEMALREAGLSAQNAQNIARALQYQRSNPRAALATVLKQYGIDGVSEANLNNLLSKYALSLGSPHLLERDLGDFLAAIHPNLRDDKEVLAILRSYVNDHKQALADYTNNQLLTYSVNLEGNETVAATTATYNNLYDTYVQIYGDDTEAILAQALYNQNLENELEIENERELYRRQQALFIRQQYVQQIEAQLAAMDNEALGEQAADLGLSIPSDQGRDQTLAQVSQAMNGQQPWMAPQVPQGEGRVRGLSRLKDWLNPKPGVSGVQNKALNAVAESGKMLSKEVVKKAALPILGGLGAGAAVYAVLQNVIGQGAALVAAGATTGAVIGGALFGIPGAIIGSIIGGGIGLIAGIYNAVTGGEGAAAAGHFAGTLPAASKAAIQNLAQSAAAPAKAIASKALGTVTTSGVPIAVNTTTTVAVAAPLVAVTTLSLLTTTAIFSAFLPDASTTQVAPYYSLDLNLSRYIQMKKIADPTNAASPTKIHYSFTISKQEDAPEDVRIIEITDTMTVIDKDSTPVNPPDIDQEVKNKLNTLTETPLTTETLTIDFVVDASDSRFANSLVRNDIKVVYTQNGTREEATTRAFTCFGDCPKITVPPCWPSAGKVTQLPRAMGGAITTNSSQLSPGTSSHSHFNALLPNDAYDIGAGSMTNFPPIYAVADGVVIYADWFKGSSALPGHKDLLIDSGYGNLTIVDHGTFVSYYAHQSSQDVKVGDSVVGGQKIGNVGTTGNSSGNHLHYEVRGFSEYVLYQTLHGNYLDTATPTCNEYYGTNN